MRHITAIQGVEPFIDTSHAPVYLQDGLRAPIGYMRDVVPPRATTIGELIMVVPNPYLSTAADEAVRSALGMPVKPNMRRDILRQRVEVEWVVYNAQAGSYVGHLAWDLLRPKLLSFDELCALKNAEAVYEFTMTHLDGLSEEAVAAAVSLHARAQLQYGPRN